MDKSLNGKHYYELLNELAVSENGLLVSSNFRDKLGFKQGDSVTYKRENGGVANGVIIDFFDYFPGYASEIIESAAGRQDVHRGQLYDSGIMSICKEKLGEVPYEVMAKLKEGATEMPSMTGKKQMICA